MPFSDDFNAGSNTNLEDWTPSGGTAWTLATGTAGAFQARTTGFCVTNGNSISPSYYVCDDQGSSDQYVSAFWVNTAIGLSGSYMACRLVDLDNFIGVRQYGTGSTGRRLSKVVSGTVTDLITVTSVANTWLKLEVVDSAGDAVCKLFDGGTGGSPSWSQTGADQTVTDSVFDSETSQGLVRLNTSGSGSVLLDNFEAGALGGGAPTLSDLQAVSITASSVQGTYDYAF